MRRCKLLTFAVMKLLTTFFATMVTALAFCQAAPPKISLTTPTEVRPGQLVTVFVKVAFADGLHGYQNPPSESYMIPVTVNAGKSLKSISVLYPKGHAAKIGGSPVEVMTYSGDIVIKVSFRAPSKTGAHSFDLNVGYQQCNDDSCFPPGSAALNGKFTVKGEPMTIWDRVADDLKIRVGSRRQS